MEAWLCHVYGGVARGFNRGATAAGASPWARVLHWLKRKKQPEHHHSFFSASWLWSGVRSCILLLPAILLGHDGLYPQRESQNKPIFPLVGLIRYLVTTMGKAISPGAKDCIFRRQWGKVCSRILMAQTTAPPATQPVKSSPLQCRQDPRECCGRERPTAMVRLY